MEHSFTLHETPLIIFTLLMQASLGLSLVVSLLFVFAKTPLNKSLNITENGKMNTTLIRRVYGLAFLLGLLAIISSTIHLGDQLHGFYILGRVFSTALPREVIFCSAFTGCSFLIMIFLTRLPIARILLLITPILGLLALIFMSSFYGQMVQTNPAWAFGYTFMRFLSAVCMLGGLLSAIIVLAQIHTTGSNILSTKSMYATAFGVMIIGLLLSFIYQPNFEFYLANVSGEVSHNIYGYLTQLSLSNWLIAIGILVACIDFSFNFIRAFSSQKPSMLMIVAFILVVIGLFISRDIFYALKNTEIM